MKCQTEAVIITEEMDSLFLLKQKKSTAIWLVGGVMMVMVEDLEVLNVFNVIEMRDQKIMTMAVRHPSVDLANYSMV